MNAVVVMVVRVIADQPSEMLFVQCDDMVKDLAPATSHPSFSDPILPGRLDTRSLGLQTGGFQERNNLGVKLRIVVKDDVAIRGCLRKCFTELSHDPLRSWVAGHVEVQDLPTSVFDDEEAVKQLEGHRRHREKVERNGHLAVILEEAQPAFTRVATALDAPKIPGDGPLRDDEAELQKRAVDLGCTPIWVVRCQPSD